MRGFAALIFFHPDCNCWSRSFTESADTEVSGRGLYRQWGITPRPEDKVFSCFLWVVYNSMTRNATPNFSDPPVPFVLIWHMPLFDLAFWQFLT